MSTTTAGPLLCPRCRSELVRLRVGGIDTDVCEHCGGLWLDRTELARFERPEVTFGEALVAHLQQFPVMLHDPAERLRCPVHPGTVMLRRPYSSSIRVQIDECPECGGHWLDADELEEIRRGRTGA